MLASINPLGERARSSRWAVTVTAYLTGSVLGGAVLGLLAAAAGVAAAGVVARLRRRASGAPPSCCSSGCCWTVGWPGSGCRRGTARSTSGGWPATGAGSTGSGSACSSALGVVTVVTSATVYATAVLCALSGSLPVGLALGALFGLARALPVVGLARTHDRAGLHRLFRRLEHWGPRADRLAQASLATGVGVLVAVAAVAATTVGGS